MRSFTSNSTCGVGGCLVRPSSRSVPRVRGERGLISAPCMARVSSAFAANRMLSATFSLRSIFRPHPFGSGKGVSRWVCNWSWLPAAKPTERSPPRAAPIKAATTYGRTVPRLGAHPTHACTGQAPDAHPRCPYGAYARPTSIQATARCSNDARTHHLSIGDTLRCPCGTRMRRTSTGDTPRCTSDTRVRRTRSQEHDSVHFRRTREANPHQGTCFSAYPTFIYDEPAPGDVLHCVSNEHPRRTRSRNPIRCVSGARVRPVPVTYLKRPSPRGSSCASRAFVSLQRMQYCVCRAFPATGRGTESTNDVLVHSLP